jgi:hypothetical protein
MANALAIVKTDFAMPAIVPGARAKARKPVLEFFGGIRNENARKAYMTACAAFFDFLAGNHVTALESIWPLHGAAYLEAMKGAKHSIATQKQHMAAVRMPSTRRGLTLCAGTDVPHASSHHKIASDAAPRYRPLAAWRLGRGLHQECPLPFKPRPLDGRRPSEPARRARPRHRRRTRGV